MATERLILEWTDAAGGFLRSGGWIDSGASLPTLGSAIALGSNTFLQAATAAVPYVSSTTAVGDVTWYLATDVAQYLFVTGTGTYVNLYIPGPKLAQFKTGGTIIDPTSGIAAAIISAAIGSLTDSAGNLVTAYVQGSKASRRTEQGAPPGG